MGGSVTKTNFGGNPKYGTGCDWQRWQHVKKMTAMCIRALLLFYYCHYYCSEDWQSHHDYRC